jgi:hypothetical protein
MQRAQLGLLAMSATNAVSLEVLFGSLEKSPCVRTPGDHDQLFRLIATRRSD